MIAGKAWGDTRQIIGNQSVELHRIRIAKGAKCSEHKHQSKWNGFYVLSGKLAVRVWKNDYALTDTTVLNAGEFCQVAPGEFHQFEALEATEALELYWTALNHSDIERRTVGVLPPKSAG